MACRLAVGVLALMLGESKVGSCISQLHLWVAVQTCCRAAERAVVAERLPLPAIAALNFLNRNKHGIICRLLQEAARKLITLKELEPLIEAKYRWGRACDSSHIGISALLQLASSLRTAGQPPCASSDSTFTRSGPKASTSGAQIAAVTELLHDGG